MPEILTESFCERCGTRYTFESAAPKQKRLGRFKVMSQGFKNFVMSDDTSLDEAFAAARNDEEREAVTQQLDAFHKTFNFCMNCRQYTCSNCWNEAEGRCLTCAPHLGHDVLAAPFPTLETNGNGAAVEDGPRLDGLAWPTLDLPPESPAAGADLAWPEPAESSGAATAEPPLPSAPEFAAPSSREDGLPDWASLVPEEAASPSEQAAASAPTEPPDLEMLLAHPALARDEEPPTEAAQEPAAEEHEPVSAEAEEPGAPEAPEPVVAQAPEPVLETPEPEAPEPVAAESDRPAVDDRAAAAAAQTADLLSRFRPGQSLDAALEEYEASLAAQDAPVETAAAAEEPAEVPVDVPVEAAAAQEAPFQAEPATPLDEVLAEEPPREAEIAAAITEEPAEVQPVAAAEIEAEPVTVAEVEAEPAAEAAPAPEAPSLPVEPQPEPEAPRAPAEDRVEVPVWRIVAPDTPTPAANGHPGETSLPTAASAEAPEWPQTPAWPGQESQVDVSFLAARLSHKPANDALWAASSRDVLAATPQQAAAPAVQTCVSCGLSLSATARFCRRCGSRQGQA